MTECSELLLIKLINIYTYIRPIVIIIAEKTVSLVKIVEIIPTHEMMMMR